MSDAEIVVSWRAALVPASGEQPVYGHLSRIGKDRAVVRIERNFLPGQRCNLAVMLPKNRPGEAACFIEASGVVAISVLTSMTFQVTLKSLELKGNGAALLSEQIRKYDERWKPL